jgi:hypothetical protein
MLESGFVADCCVRAGKLAFRPFSSRFDAKTSQKYDQTAGKQSSSSTAISFSSFHLGAAGGGRAPSVVCVSFGCKGSVITFVDAASCSASAGFTSASIAGEVAAEACRCGRGDQAFTSVSWCSRGGFVQVGADGIAVCGRGLEASVRCGFFELASTPDLRAGDEQSSELGIVPAAGVSRAAKISGVEVAFYA